MPNMAMQRKLKAGRAVDISDRPRTATGDYLLASFEEGKDYCDARAQSWVWSIGKLLRPLPSVMADGSRITLPAGSYLASLTSRYYNPEESQTIECVFVR